MASIRTSKVNNKLYVQVIDHYYDEEDKVRRLKILKSFGRLSLESKIDAITFLANVEAIEEIKKKSSVIQKKELIQQVSNIGHGFLATYLGNWVIEWIINK